MIMYIFDMYTASTLFSFISVCGRSRCYSTL